MLFGQFDVTGFDCFVCQRIILQLMELLLLPVEQKGKELAGKQMNGNFPLLNLFSSLRYKCILDGQRNQSFCIRRLGWCLQHTFMKFCVSGFRNNLEGKIGCGLTQKHLIMFLCYYLKEILIVQICENKLLHSSRTPLV